MSNTPVSALVRLDDVSKEYPTASKPLQVLSHIHLSLNPGERLAIIGPSGCGKSTLLNLMGTLDTPTEGRIWIEDKNTATLSPTELARLRNQKIGFVFQFHHLLPQCTVLENILIPALIAGRPEAARSRAISLLEKVGLADRAETRPTSLSGGERQRVAVVRALINRPAILLADEPTGSLNEDGAEELTTLLLTLSREENMALVMVTHAGSIAARMDRILALHHGALAVQE